jgi:hypothetical protein
MIPCGICKGIGKVKSKSKLHQPDLVCTFCKGLGESEYAEDGVGRVIIPGGLVRRPRLPFTGMPAEYEGRMPGYKGTVLAVYKDQKDNIVVLFRADPLLSPAGKASKNHGTHSCRPENLRVIFNTAVSKRLKTWEQRCKEKEEEEDE